MISKEKTEPRTSHAYGKQVVSISFFIVSENFEKKSSQSETMQLKSMAETLVNQTPWRNTVEEHYIIKNDPQLAIVLKRENLQAPALSVSAETLPHFH